jgi:hypothetical protein
MAWRSAGATRGLSGVPSVSHGLFDRDSDARREKPGWSLPIAQMRSPRGMGSYRHQLLPQQGASLPRGGCTLHGLMTTTPRSVKSATLRVTGNALLDPMAGAVGLAVERLAGASVRSMALNRGGSAATEMSVTCDKLQWIVALSTEHFVNVRHGSPVWLDWSRAVPSGQRRRRPMA